MSSMMQTSIEDALKEIVKATNEAVHAQYLVCRMSNAKIEGVDELLVQSEISEMFQDTKEALLIAEGKLNKLIFALRYQELKLSEGKEVSNE